MTIVLRDYQLEAVNACACALKEHPSTLIVAATGAGKSLILAHIAERVTKRYPEARVLVLCYVQEILESNNAACESLGLDSGIYCASLGRRDTSHRVIHASRDSLGNNPEVCGQFDMVIVDEAHLLSEKEESRYIKILDTLNPKWLVGLTATPYRLDGGLIYGKKKRFKSLCFEISHAMLVSKEFLVPYVFPERQPKSLVNLLGVKMRGGDFDAKQVDALVCDRETVAASLREWAAVAHSRKCSLFFCHSVAHAKLCLEIFSSIFPDIPAGYLDGTTNREERSALIDDAKAGKYRVLFQINTMSTGTNIPIIDCIVWLRPTASASLFVQGSGRGSRLAPGKEDCLIVDLVGNMDRFQCLYDPNVVMRGKKKKEEFTDEELIEMGIDPKMMKGDAVTKQCPRCGHTVHGAAKKCNNCGKLFITLAELYTGADPGQLAEVVDYAYEYTATQKGDRCFKVTYVTSRGRYTEWILFQKPWLRGTYAARKKMVRDENVRITHLKIEQTNNKKFPKLTPYVLTPEELERMQEQNQTSSA